MVITADGGYRNAEVVPYKSTYTDPALDNYIPRPAALEALSATLRTRLSADVAERLEAQVSEAIAGEITLERADVMRELGLALERERGTAPEVIAELRTTVASELANVGHAVTHVIVIRYTGNDIVEHARDSWSPDLVAQVETDLLADAGVADRAALYAWTTPPFGRLWDPMRRRCPSRPTGRSLSFIPRAQPANPRAWSTPMAAGSRGSRIPCEPFLMPTKTTVSM